MKLFVGQPVCGPIPTGHLNCLAALWHSPPCSLKLVQVGKNSPVADARNRLTAEFLKTDCDAILWLDSDILFTVDDIRRLISHGKAVVGGLYAKKKPGPPEWVLNALPGRDGSPSRPNSGRDGSPSRPPSEPSNGRFGETSLPLVQVAYIGTGFLLVQREVFEIMQRARPDDWYDRDETGAREHDYWPMGIFRYADGRRRWLTEDWYFCQRWLDLGGEVWADTGITLGHIGEVVFPIPVAEAAGLGPRPPAAATKGNA